MVSNRSNVAEQKLETLKLIKSWENKRDSIERQTIERRNTVKGEIHHSGLLFFAPNVVKSFFGLVPGRKKRK